MNDRNFIFISHRGESIDLPENTISSINLAWQRNVDAVEIDVRLTKDNKIVVIHDKSTKRTGDKNYIIKNSSSLELLNVNISNKKYSPEKIPFLEEVMRTIPFGKKLFIDLKVGNEIVYYLKDILIKNDYKDKIVLISTNVSTLKTLKNELKGIETYLVIDRKWYNFIFNSSKLIKIYKKFSFNGIVIKDSKYLTKEFVDYFKKEDLKIFVWTVNDLLRAQYLYKVGVNGITSDQAGVLMENMVLK